MGDETKLSVHNMVELAMGLSMASLFANAMNDSYNNTARMLNNDQVAAPPKYIHAIVGGMQKGPFTLGEVQAMIQTGDVTLETYLWMPGIPAWKRAREITNINASFNATPPQTPENQE
ncbi:MAG: DUF4339 domain-containing protein [Rikenellaceae bacterium]|jgi:hypothetical protein|nr:DUF4339 domain-containing protein [Rikenellaceae bacterium]